MFDELHHCLLTKGLQTVPSMTIGPAFWIRRAVGRYRMRRFAAGRDIKSKTFINCECMEVFERAEPCPKCLERGVFSPELLWLKMSIHDPLWGATGVGARQKNTAFTYEPLGRSMQSAVP